MTTGDPVAEVLAWLSVPPGAGLVRAVSVLLTAAAAYLAYLAKRQSEQNAKMLNGHMESHVEHLTNSIETNGEPTEES